MGLGKSLLSFVFCAAILFMALPAHAQQEVRTSGSWWNYVNPYYWMNSQPQQTQVNNSTAMNPSNTVLINGPRLNISTAEMQQLVTRSQEATRQLQAQPQRETW